jgi:hypothetical protein
VTCPSELSAGGAPAVQPAAGPAPIARGFVAWRIGRLWSKWHLETLLVPGRTLCGVAVGPVADRHGRDCPVHTLAAFCRGCLVAYARRAP